MTRCSDDFSDGVLDPALWTSVVTGTGVVTEIGGAVKLETGTTAGASAAIRSVEMPTGVDVAATFTPDVTLPIGGTVRAASLALRVDATTEFRLDLEVTRTVSTLRVLERVNGATFLDLPIIVGGPIPGAVTLRLLRSGSRVQARINDQTIVSAVFVGDAASYEFLVSNDATYDSSVRTKVTSYVRSPAVVFGDAQVLSFLFRSDGTVVVATPAHELPDTVTITVYGCGFFDTVVNGFEYVLGDRKVIGRTAAKSLVVLNDVRLKEN